MNAVFIAIVSIAFCVSTFRQLVWSGPDDVSPMAELGQAVIEAASGSVTLALGLVGVMALFLGLMKVAERGGLLIIIAKTLRPLLVRLFPDVPANHPAMGAMILNMAANVLGLGNAATPFGIRAMQQLDSLNPNKGTASDSMVLFLAINTSSITLVPTGVIALRFAAGSEDPAGIVPTTLFATICSTAIAIFTAKLLAKRWPQVTNQSQTKSLSQPISADIEEPHKEWSDGASGSYPVWVSISVFIIVMTLVPMTVVYGRIIAPWIIPSLMIGLLWFGWCRGVCVYEAFIEGAKDGFDVALRIIPYLIAILVAVGMFRASGAMDLIINPLGTLTEIIGLPAEALPMALLRPLSGSGAYGILASIIQNPSIGPDSYVGYLVSTFQGSTETTFYVLAVYFGAVGIRRIRHALVAALCADIAGIAAAVFIVGKLYG